MCIKLASIKELSAKFRSHFPEHPEGKHMRKLDGIRYSVFLGVKYELGRCAVKVLPFHSAGTSKEDDFKRVAKNDC